MSSQSPDPIELLSDNVLPLHNAIHSSLVGPANEETDTCAREPLSQSWNQWEEIERGCKKIGESLQNPDFVTISPGNSCFYEEAPWVKELSVKNHRPFVAKNRGNSLRVDMHIAKFIMTREKQREQILLLRQQCEKQLSEITSHLDTFDSQTRSFEHTVNLLSSDQS